jgi:predicted DNA binding CopG/RHH family protein
MATRKRIPDFVSEEEEVRFWEKHAIEEYLPALEDAPPPRVAPEAQTQAISLRLPASMLAALKRVAAAEGVGYQTLMKRWLRERLRHEAHPACQDLAQWVGKAQQAIADAGASLEEIRKRA